VAIHDNELLGDTGEYGDPLVSDPLAYDELVIKHAEAARSCQAEPVEFQIFTSSLPL